MLKKNMMKKTLSLLVGTALALVCMGCPDSGGGEDEPNSPNRPEGATGPIPAPLLLESGSYVVNTKILIETLDESASILYTLDGSEPLPSNPSAKVYDPWFPPRLKFDDDTTAITVKARAAKNGRESSAIVTGAYTERKISPSAKVTALAATIAADPKGATANDPYPIVLDSTWTMADAGLSYKDPENPVQELYDGLYHLFNAARGKYFTLDLSAVQEANWKDEDEDGNLVFSIPGINWTEGVAKRPNKDRLVGVKYPAGVVNIGARAFQNASNYKKIDLSNLNRLQTISPYAFAGTGPSEIKFNGCSELHTIADYAFNGSNTVASLDFTQTKLKRIGERVFGTANELEWIEYPATLDALGSYLFGSSTTLVKLKYVRHRSVTQPDGWAWDLYNYHNNPTADAPATHLHEGIDGEYAPKNDRMFVIYHPNTSAWTKKHGGFFAGADDDGYYFIAQNVPLGPPTDNANFNPASGTRFYDALRGDALIQAQEDYRGLNSVAINLAGISGQVTSNIGITLTGGTSTTIGIPPAGLKPMTPANFQELTIPSSDPRNKGPFGVADTWSVGGNTGSYAQPWITDSNAQYVVLQLSQGTNKKVVREISHALGKDEWQNFSSEKRTVSYVYVDRDVVVHRVMRVDSNKKYWLRTVALSLKRGWNLVDTVTRVDSSTAFTKSPTYTEADYPLGSDTSIWISGGITCGVDNVSGDSTRNLLTYRDIPWVAK